MVSAAMASGGPAEIDHAIKYVFSKLDFCELKEKTARSNHGFSRRQKCLFLLLQAMASRCATAYY